MITVVARILQINTLTSRAYVHTHTHTHTHTHLLLVTPSLMPINRDAIAQQLINRRGKVVDNYDEDTMVRSHEWISREKSVSNSRGVDNFLNVGRLTTVFTCK